MSVAPHRARGGRSALPNPLPGLRSGILSTSELATLWQLPRARSKLARIPRSAMRRAVAPPQASRARELELLRDEQGPVGLAPDDRKYGHALIGGQGGGKSSVLLRHLLIAARDRQRAVLSLDGKGPTAEAALGMIPADRAVHYLDLGQPQIGFNPLQIGASPGATAAATRDCVRTGSYNQERHDDLHQTAFASNRRVAARQRLARPVDRLPGRW